MKQFFKLTGLGALLVLTGLALSGIIATISPTTARAASFTIPTQNPAYFTATNLPATVATTVTTNTTSYVEPIPGRGMSMAFKFNVSSGTSNAVIFLYPQIDSTGTNYSTVAWSTNTATATSTTDTSVVFNWSAASLSGMKSFRIGIYNQNAGTLTNKGIVFNRL